jgi:hypothetical protein
VIKVEFVRLLEIFELPAVLSGYDGGRTGAEAAVVDSGDVTFVVGEFGPDLGGCD